MAKIETIAMSCEDNHCPTLYRGHLGDVTIRGYVVDDQASALPTGETMDANESVVSIPSDVFDRLVEQYLAARVAA